MAGNDGQEGFPPEEAPETPESPRYWPKWGAPPPERRLEVRCPRCSLLWWIHQDLAGFRLRCECGAWLDVPPGEQEPLAPLLLPGHPVQEKELEQLPGNSLWTKDEDRWFQPSEELPGKVYEEDIPTSLPLAPGTLRHASVKTRQRWTNRSILELAGMLCAFWIPSALVFFLAEGRAKALYMPFASLAAGLLVLLVGLSSGIYTFGLLRKARLRFFLEAGLLAFCTAFLALGLSRFLQEHGVSKEGLWLETVKEVLGIPWMLLLIGTCPAVFEELAFRGLLQGRLAALLGENLGILATGSAFALAHGITTGFPFHMFLGLYLCWLRVRCHSLLPCMVLHFLYNSTLVILA